MKKIMFILFALLLSSSVFAQNGTTSTNAFQDGYTRGAYAQIGAIGTGDSLHYIGRFLMRDGYTAIDSLTFLVTNTDSLRYGVLVKVGGVSHTTDTIRVPLGDGVAGAAHYVQKTAAGITQIPWHAINTATGGEATAAKHIDLYLWVYQTGTEAQPVKANPTLTGDTMNIFPKAYK